jgi:asparagine synthase (glutamine-hydrolysing)
MPGIAGIISKKSLGDWRPVVSAMLGAMMHEKTCSASLYADPAIGVYAGLVAPRESFSGGAALRNEDGDVALLFSGETLRDTDAIDELKRKGHNVGTSRAGWLPHLYEEHGDCFIKKLNGFFGGLVIDSRQGRAVLFNDRYGIERLYWCETNDAIYFATEAKALLRVRPELRTFDELAVWHFLMYGCALEWRTLFKGIHVVPAGSMWIIQSGECKQGYYFDPAEWEAQEPLTADAFDAELGDALTAILPTYFENGASSNVAMALTGGLDTRMVMACRPAKTDVPCYTYAGASGTTLDMTLAARVAEACGLPHHVLRLEPDFFSNFGAHADGTIYRTDGTAGIMLTHESYLSANARRFGNIRMTGVFGGEVLRGVSTFKRTGFWEGLVEPSWRAPMANWAYSAPDRHPVTAAAFREMPWKLFGSLAACRSQLTFRTPFLDHRIVKLAYRAPEATRTTTDSSRRLIRDRDPKLAAFPTDRAYMDDRTGLGRSLTNAVSDLAFKLDYRGTDGLPHWLTPLDPVLDVLHSRAWVVGSHRFLRYRRWFRQQLSQYLRERVESAGQNPMWDRQRLSRLADDHIAGRRNHVMDLNAVLTLEAVDRLLLRTEAHAGKEVHI